VDHIWLSSFSKAMSSISQIYQTSCNPTNITIAFRFFLEGTVSKWLDEFRNPELRRKAMERNWLLKGYWDLILFVNYVM
jgi:hypothetical protein